MNFAEFYKTVITKNAYEWLLKQVTDNRGLEPLFSMVKYYEYCCYQ